MPVLASAPRKPSVLVVGAGIGGLAAAALLGRRGIEVTVCEQARRLQEVGAGVQLSANAMKVLRALDLEEAIVSRGFLPAHFVGWSWRSGRRLYRTPIRPLHEERFGAPYVHIHRADLLDALADRVPTGSVRLGHRLVGLAEADGIVRATFDDGRCVDADVVVGADGIHSAVRRSLFGEEAPRFTGHMCWRGLVPAARLPADLVPPASSNWMGPNGHVVHYFVRGGSLVNFVAVRDTEAWHDESWNTPSSTEELLRAFEGWHPRLTTLFERATGLHRWGLFDRDPLPEWSRGRVTLLGDAAHPMLPFLAQGAAQALEDAYALADWLDRYPRRPEAALAAYAGERRERTARIQLAARERGRTIHLRSRWTTLKRDLAFAWRQAVAPSATTHQGEWIYRHDVGRVERTLGT